MKRRVTVLTMLAALVTIGWGCCPAAGEVRPKLKKMREPDSVYVGTPYDVVAKMLQMADVKKADIVYDLGCGDGRIVAMAAKWFGCRAAGYDIDPQRISESLDNIKRNNVEHLVKIDQEDIFKLDLSGADVITLYLLPHMNIKLVPQLEKLKPGSRIVAQDYGIKGYKPDKTVEYISNEDNASHIIMLFTTPLKRK
jgi:SAM-dependent methyltransferase